MICAKNFIYLIKKCMYNKKSKNTSSAKITDICIASKLTFLCTLTLDAR